MKAKEIKNKINQSLIFDELAWTPPSFLWEIPTLGSNQSLRKMTREKLKKSKKSVKDAKMFTIFRSWFNSFCFWKTLFGHRCYSQIHVLVFFQNHINAISLLKKIQKHKKINLINGFLLYKIFSKNKNILIFWSKNPYVKHFEILWKIKINIIYPSVFALEKYEVIWTKTIESWGNALTRML